MSAFQGVQLAANLGQQNFNQQLALDKRLDSRSDEMWDRYAFEKKMAADQAKEILYPTIEKMFSQAMESSPIGEFLSTISGESRVSVAEAVKNAEMDAQDRIRQRMIDKAIADGTPMMTIGGSTEPEQQTQPPASDDGAPSPKSADGGLPPATAPVASDVRIPEGVTPEQAQAIRNVATRGANAPASQRVGYNIPGVELYPNPYGDGIVARFPKTGKTAIYSKEDLAAIQGAIKAENAAIIADGVSSAGRSAARQAASDMVLAENFNHIQGDKARRQALEAGVIDQRTHDFMVRYGIVPTQDEWQDLIKNHISLEGLIDTVRDRTRNEKKTAIDDEIKNVGTQLKSIQAQMDSGKGGGGAGGAYDVGGDSTPGDGPVQQGIRSSLQDQYDFLSKRQQKLHTRSRSLYNHNIHGSNPNLGLYATGSNKRIDSGSMDDLMRLAASKLTGETDPSTAMRVLPSVITDSNQFLTEFIPALVTEARSAGWHIDEQNPLDAAWWAQNYITHIDDSVKIEAVRKQLAKDDAAAQASLAVEPDLTTADSDYVSGFRESMKGTKDKPASETVEGESSYLSDYINQQGIPDLDESTSLTQGQISDFAMMLGVSEEYARQYLARYREQYGLDTAGMQRYHANLTSGVDRRGRMKAEPVQQNDN